MKTVLITGASRGIGASCARLFLKNGYKVVVNYNKSEEEALEVCKGFETSSLIVKADVSSIKDVSKMFAIAKEKFSKVDILINNAGVSEQKLFSDITESDFDTMFAVNVKGVFNCCKQVVPDMVRNHEGIIINISSMWGLVGASCEVHYSASKGAIIAFTKALAKELGPSNIRVNCVAPGVIETNMNANLSKDDISKIKDETPLCMIGQPSDIANLVLFLASDKSKFITGQVISSNGGFVI